MDFLKVALAAPDFGTGTFSGIPDAYDGRVITKSWTYTGSLPALTDGLDTFIVQAPVPGVAYFYGQVGAGNLVLNPVYYSDFLSVFPLAAESSNAQSFRYGGQAMEIIPTVNAMTWAGSVQVFRGEANLTLSGQAGSCSLSIAGLSALINSKRPDAVHPFNLGCFCPSRQTQADFPFHPVNTNTVWDELYVATYSGSGAGITVSFAAGVTGFVGMGSMETIVYKIPGYNKTANSLTLRTWAYNEFQVSSSSSLYEYAHMSPMHDPFAMALVKKAYMELQLCVPFYENDGIWSKILSFIKTASGALSFVPGPMGEAAAGVGMIANALEVLTV